MNKLSEKKVMLIEFSLIIVPSIIYYLISIGNKNLFPEFLINLSFILLLLSLLIFRSSNLRHMYLGMVFLLLSTLFSVFGMESFVYILSSFALSLFILGVLNMILFGSVNFGSDSID